MAGGVNAGADRNPQACRAPDIRALRIVRTAASRRSDARASPARWALLSQATATKAGNQKARFASVCEMGRSREGCVDPAQSLPTSGALRVAGCGDLLALVRF